MLGCRHLLSHRQNGIEIQTYCAIIACLLISLWTGRKPTLRTYEMICFYFCGMATRMNCWPTSPNCKDTTANPTGLPSLAVRRSLLRGRRLARPATACIPLCSPAGPIPYPSPPPLHA